MLKIDLRSSWMLAAILAVAHCAAIVLVVQSGMALWLQIIASTALAASLVTCVRQTALLLTPQAVVAIEIVSDDTFSAKTRRGNWVRCDVLDSTYVASFLSVLNLKEIETGKVRNVVILPDSIDAEDFRRLRVWLRWKRGTPPA